ncbi:MAG TPA: DUF4097 family beta strand repeat-containing protein [Pyrinomonadaceae bacterium]|jgi:hypothetical protein
MNHRTLTSSLVAVALVCGLALRPLAAAGQEGQGSVAINNAAGRVSIKLERGSKVAISNRYGRITITGWERDTVEAVATSEKGQEAIQVELTADPQARSVLALSVPGRAGQRRVLVPGMDFDFDLGPVVVGAIAGGVGKGTGTGKGQGSGTTKVEVDKEKIKAEIKEQIKEQARGQTPGAESNVVIAPNVVVRPEVVVTPRPAPAPRARAATAQTMPPGQAPQAAQARTSSRIDLDVKVPRYAELSTIEVRSGDLTVSNIDGPVNISSSASNVRISRVGALEVRARSGDVTAEDVAGLAYVIASSGDIVVRRAQGDVRAVTINGDIDIQCVRGRVDVSTARGAIKLGGISGDVDATTTSSDITYTGLIRDNGRYRLKSVEGGVSMAVPDNAPGFTALLSSYNGAVQTDFPIKTQTVEPTTQVNRRVEARTGNGQAQITLDSFSQPVRLTRLAPGATVGCP